MRALRGVLCGLVLAVCAIAASAADAGYKHILVGSAADAIEVRLPLTDVSGPARVKQRSADGFGMPVAPTKTPLDTSTYIEWQIGYDTLDPQHWSIAPSVKFKREGRTKYGCELSQMLAEAHRLGFLSGDQLRRESDTLAGIGDATLEAQEKIALAPDADTLPGQAARGGFARHVQKVPAYVKETPHGRIEIQLKQKQRAVGYQAMVYVCIPQTQWLTGDASRPPRAARTKETVTVRFDEESAAFLLDIVRAFGIASSEHNDDLRKIIGCILADSKAR